MLKNKEKTSSIPVLVTLQELAEWLKKSSRSVYRDVQGGYLPPPFKVGGSPRWNCEEVLNYMTEKRGLNASI